MFLILKKNVFDLDKCFVFFHLTDIFCILSFSFTIRYKSLVACKVQKKQNNQRKENKEAHFIHSRVAMCLQHEHKFSDDYIVITADTRNKVHVGTLAVSRYQV